MGKIIIFISLFLTYLLYSFTVYTKGTDDTVTISPAELLRVSAGKEIYQQYNCTSCHQLYGLGGYLGPELTTVYSDPAKGEPYIRALLKGGGQRMPNFYFTDKNIDDLVCFLKYVDSTAITYKSLSR